MNSARWTAILALSAGLALALSGCGRKTYLDTPYEAAIDAREQAERDGEPLPPPPEPPVKDRPFILDPLL